MRCLLDTHTFLWFIGRHPALPSAIRERIEQPTTLRFLSIASLWEMAIKINAGKLEIGMPFPTLVHDHVVGNGIMLLSIDADHLEIFSQLPLHHRDPFDRLLIAQAMTEGMTLLSRDGMFDQYGVQRQWV
ncbi:MAG: type II toxin-antitoxin system VapC family toxin [Herpetosiphonaceae bacterium]|nr:type II toxin-antitoxin system VapC family toxin [Herpetosiphonaceae bacterium]